MPQKPSYEELEDKIQILIKSEFEKKQEIKNLRKNKTWHSSLFNAIQAAVVVHDADTKIIASNSKAQELLGLTENHMLGKTAFDQNWKFFRPDGEKMAVNDYPVNQVLSSKSPIRDLTCGLSNPSITIPFWVQVNADPVFDWKGKIQQVIVSFVDITSRKKAEETLREKTATLNNILQKAADGICVCHNITSEPYVRFTHWNPRMIDITGYTIDEINKLGWYQTVYPDPEIRKSAIEKMTQMREGKNLHSEEWVITTKSGKEKNLSISTSIVKKNEKEIHVLGIMQDISERKQIENALRESQRKYHNIVEKSDDIIWTADLDLQTTYVSSSIEKKLGFTPEERMKQGLETQMPSSSYTAIIERLSQELEKEQDENADPERVIRTEMEYYHKNGSILWFENIASGLRDENGLLIGVQGISRDITDKKLAEKILQESEEKMRAIFNASPLAIVLLGQEGRVLDLNDEYAARLKMTRDQIMGKCIWDLFPTTVRTHRKNQTENVFKTGKPFSGEDEREGICNEYHIYPAIKDESGNVTAVIVEVLDITWRKHAEKALLEEKNKLEDALLEIKKLSGMLPICSSCKKIRDDKGYWKQIEVYITEHSEADFTHSICPECVKKLYPDLNIYKK